MKIQLNKNTLRKALEINKYEFETKKIEFKFKEI